MNPKPYNADYREASGLLHTRQRLENLSINQQSLSFTRDPGLRNIGVVGLRKSQRKPRTTP